MLTFSGDAAGAINTIDAYMRLDPLYPDIALYFLAEARICAGAVRRRRSRPSNSGSSATPIQRRPMLCLHRATVTSAGLPKARAAWAEVMRIAPDFSIERQRRILPYKNPDDFERRIEGMRKAGLPV